MECSLRNNFDACHIERSQVDQNNDSILGSLNDANSFEKPD